MKKFLDLINGKKTFILGAVGIIVAAMVQFGFITPEDAKKLQDGMVKMLENITSLGLVFASLWAIFQRLATSKAEKKADEAAKAVQKVVAQ